MSIEQIYFVGFIITWIGVSVYHIIDNPFSDFLSAGLLGLFFGLFWPII